MFEFLMQKCCYVIELTIPIMRYLYSYFCLFLEKINRLAMKGIQILVLMLFLPIGLFAQDSSKLFFVFLNSNPQKEVLDTNSINELQRRHLENIDRLYSEGKIIAAGPFYHGGGLFIFKENSIENVQNLLQTDPAIAAKRFLIEIFPLRFITGQVCSFDEPVEMITLSFIRVFKQKTEKTEKMISEWSKKWDKELLSSAVFEEDQGGFMVLSADLESLKKQIPSILNDAQENQSIRQLYIAKGTFCRVPKK